MIKLKPIVSSTLPPGGGVCYWCSGKLYRDKDANWHYATIIDNGIERSVHISQCGGPTYYDRPEEYGSGFSESEAYKAYLDEKRDDLKKRYK